MTASVPDLRERASAIVVLTTNETLLDGDQRMLELAETVIHDLFGLGLALHTTLPMVSGEPADRLTAAIDATDRIIRHVRDVVYASGVVSRLQSQRSTGPEDHP